MIDGLRGGRAELSSLKVPSVPEFRRSNSRSLGNNVSAIAPWYVYNDSELPTLSPYQHLLSAHFTIFNSLHLLQASLPYARDTSAVH